MPNFLLYMEPEGVLFFISKTFCITSNLSSLSKVTWINFQSIVYIIDHCKVINSFTELMIKETGY